MKTQRNNRINGLTGTGKHYWSPCVESHLEAMACYRTSDNSQGLDERFALSIQGGHPSLPIASLRQGGFIG